MQYIEKTFTYPTPKLFFSYQFFLVLEKFQFNIVKTFFGLKGANMNQGQRVEPRAPNVAFTKALNLWNIMLTNYLVYNTVDEKGSIL